jgi:threonine/homoserine/homoserine lactone efflux protein
MLESVLKGLALGFALALSVGPIIFIIIKHSLNNGHRAGFSFVAGVWVSDIILVVLSNTLSAAVDLLNTHEKIVGCLGGLFLLGMGVYFAFFKKVKMQDPEKADARFRKRDMARLFASGFAINTLNPSVIFFWLVNATLVAGSHTIRERIIIFSICLLINMSADVGKVMMAGKLRNKLNLHTLKIVNKISGSLLIVFGVVLACDVLLFHKK